MFGFIKRLFRGNPAIDLPDSPEIWRAGDLAECIRRSRWVKLVSNEVVGGPKFGDVARVMRVDWHYGVQWLFFADDPEVGRHSLSFRKVQPRADELTAAEPEFVQLITRQPAREDA